MNSRLLLLFGALSVAACASPPLPASNYIGENGQVGSITGTPGKRLLSVVAEGNPALGAGVQADCELRAMEIGAAGTWQLVPFKSDTMEVDDADVRGVPFDLQMRTDGTFAILTNFGERSCGAGLTFSGQYRRN